MLHASINCDRSLKLKDLGHKQFCFQSLVYKKSFLCPYAMVTHGGWCIHAIINDIRLNNCPSGITFSRWAIWSLDLFVVLFKRESTNFRDPELFYFGVFKLPVETKKFETVVKCLSTTFVFELDNKTKYSIVCWQYGCSKILQMGQWAIPMSEWGRQRVSGLCCLFSGNVCFRKKTICFHFCFHFYIKENIFKEIVLLCKINVNHIMLHIWYLVVKMMK